MVSIPYIHNDIKASTDREAAIHQVDSDGDYLPDYVEVKMGTDPLNQDSDFDLLPDLEEIYLGTSPTEWDTDGDHIADGHEKGSGDESTSPFQKDSDHDGLADPWEDNDGDGLLNREEQLPMHDGVCFWVDLFGYEWDEDFGDRIPTDPNNADTDGDGLEDGVEIQVDTINSTGSSTPVVDRKNTELDIANSNSYAYWLLRNFFGWDDATFADWRTGLKLAGSYNLIPSQCTMIAWYHFSPFWVYEHIYFGNPSPPNFLTWKTTYFHGSAINPDYGVSNEELRGDWDRGSPYEWNQYDCDPTLNDTDADFMDDDWDVYPLKYNTRNGTYAAVLGVRRLGEPYIPAIAPRTTLWNFFGHNISILELEKGDWIDINISIGLEHCNTSHLNYLEEYWRPISVVIQFRKVDLGSDNTAHTGDDDLNATNEARLTRPFTNVDAAHRIPGMSERNFTNHLGIDTTLTFYFQMFRIRIPSRVPAGQIAIVVETECENNFHYFPSDEYPAY